MLYKFKSGHSVQTKGPTIRGWARSVPTYRTGPQSLAQLVTPVCKPRALVRRRRYRCNRNCTGDEDDCFSESLIKRTADLMVPSEPPPCI